MEPTTLMILLAAAAMALYRMGVLKLPMQGGGLPPAAPLFHAPAAPQIIEIVHRVSPPVAEAAPRPAEDLAHVMVTHIPVEITLRPKPTTPLARD